MKLHKPPISALTVRGTFRGPSGYAHVVREFVSELHKQGVAVQLLDLPGWHPVKLPWELQDPWFETLHAATGAQIVLHFCMPHQVVPYPAKKALNYTMFEATRIPKDWVELSEKYDLTVLPTESSRQAWIRSGVAEDRIRVCPLGINPSVFSGDAEPLEIRFQNGDSLAQYGKRFLNVSELDPRKNLAGLIRAWIKATSATQDDAVLLIKLGCSGSGSWELFHAKIKKIEAQLGKGLRDAAPVHFMQRLLTDRDMPRLYAAATHYISLSFGEGWDQPMLEAAVSGLRLIAPRHSAYETYLDPSVATLIPSRETPVVYDRPKETAMLFENANWWQPDEDHAVAAIRSAIEGSDTRPASARTRILAEFTWERSTQRLIEILNEV